MVSRSLLKTGVYTWNVCEDNHEDDLLKRFMCQLADRKIEIMEPFSCNDSAEVIHFLLVFLQAKFSKKSARNVTLKKILKIEPRLMIFVKCALARWPYRNLWNYFIRNFEFFFSIR